MSGHKYASITDMSSRLIFFSLSNEFYDLVDHMTETKDFSSKVRVFTRYCEYTTIGSILVSRLRRCCIRLMILVCVCTWKLHAEDDPAVESQAAVLCGNARSPSCFIDLVAYPSSSSSSAIQHPRCSFTLLPNLRRAILFLFCFSFSLCSFDPAHASLPLLFRRIFCPR